MNYTSGKWKMVPNSSWGEKHKENFGERAGYVICHYDRGQLCAHASIIGMPFRSQEEIDANAKLITTAPEMLDLLVVMVGRADSLKYNHDIITKAKEIIKKATQ